MEEKTIKEILNFYGCTLTQMAAYTGLSISLLSKIKNGNSTITEDTKYIFREKYNVILVGGAKKWKLDALQYKQKIEELEDIIFEKDREITRLNDLLYQIQKISEER